MTPRVLYEGGISVASNDYTHLVGSDYTDEAELENLDVVVSHRKSLGFTLDYPFELPYEGKVAGDGGVTLRMIIHAVRSGFREMYAGASLEDVPPLLNKSVVGTYGTAVHAIEDLVIEQIDLLEEDGRIEIGIGS